MLRLLLAYSCLLRDDICSSTIDIVCQDLDIWQCYVSGLINVCAWTIDLPPRLHDYVMAGRQIQNMSLVILSDKSYLKCIFGGNETNDILFGEIACHWTHFLGLVEKKEDRENLFPACYWQFEKLDQKFQWDILALSFIPLKILRNPEQPVTKLITEASFCKLGK